MAGNLRHNRYTPGMGDVSCFELTVGENLTPPSPGATRSPSVTLIDTDIRGRGSLAQIMDIRALDNGCIHYLRFPLFASDPRAPETTDRQLYRQPRPARHSAPCGMWPAMWPAFSRCSLEKRNFMSRLWGHQNPQGTCSSGKQFRHCQSCCQSTQRTEDPESRY